MEDSIRPVKLGTQARCAEFNGFVVTETVRPPGKVQPRHYHAHTNIGLALRGTFVETIGTRPIAVHPGSLTFLPAGEIHSDHYDREEARCLIIEPDSVLVCIGRPTDQPGSAGKADCEEWRQCAALCVAAFGGIGGDD